MTEIFVASIILFGLLTLGLFAVYVALGPAFAALYVLFMIGVWVALEMWVHNYISKYGTLSLLNLPELCARVDTLSQEIRELKSHFAALTLLLREKDVISTEQFTEVTDAIDAEIES